MVKKQYQGTIKFLALSLGVFWLQTQAQEHPYASHMSAGFRNISKTKISEDLNPAQSPWVKAAADSRIEKIMDELYSKNSSRIIIVSQKNQIVYDRRPWLGSKNSTPMGYSMTKSLVSLALGRALCSGQIRDLDQQASLYLPAELADSSWGQSRIVDLLKMSSGAYRSDIKYNGHRSKHDEDQFASLYLGAMRLRFTEVMLPLDSKDYKPGQQFNYSNMDTIALGMIIERATGQSLPEFFSNTIWKDIDPQQAGYWIVNNHGEVASYSGFSALPEDWVRLGQYVLRELNSSGCFGDYLRKATAPQITTIGREPRFIETYGYHIWTRCSRHTDFCFLGFAGQHLVFNKETDTVLYHHAASLPPATQAWRTVRYFDQVIELIENDRKTKSNLRSH